MSTVALVGAGGKMGCRITDNMKNQTAYRMLHVEVAPAGLANLAKRGVAAVAAAEAVPAADFVVLAVPDNRVETISAQVVPLMKAGAVLVHLDPAAPCAGRVFKRADVAYFVTHPCHPPVFNDETDLEARCDFFGGRSRRSSTWWRVDAGPRGRLRPRRGPVHGPLPARDERPPRHGRADGHPRTGPRGDDLGRRR